MDVSGKTVLVVDDDRMVLMGLSMVMQSWGMNVLAAGSLAEAEARAGEAATLEVILSDLNLPDASGFDVVERVRAIAGGPVPALFLTGTVGRPEGAGYTFLLKPVQPDTLRHALATAMAG